MDAQRALAPSDEDSAQHARADRPPVVRFLLMFAILLTAALGLAALNPGAADDESNKPLPETSTPISMEKPA